MPILSEATYLHMEVSRAIDAIGRRLDGARDHRDDRKRLPVELARIIPRADDLSRQLRGFYTRERQELFPRAERIFGARIEEIEALIRYQKAILSALDEFIEELTVSISGQQRAQGAHLAYLEVLFQEFVELYEARCQIESAFYQSYSTMLYPGGLSTE